MVPYFGTMKYRTFAFALFTPFLTIAQENANSLLWQISGNGLSSTNYVYGTVHSKDERAFTHVQAVEDRMGSVSTVAGELDLNAARSANALLMRVMLLPADTRLEDLYKKKEWQEVEAFIKAELGVMAMMVSRMKPFFIMATMTEANMTADREKVLDDHLLEYGRENGHRIIGLETVQEQLQAMDALSLKEQAAMLLDHVRNEGYREELEAMMVAYAAQDLEMLMRVTETSGMPEELEKVLLTQRNMTMAHRMDSVMHVDNGAMFLIGAAHLPGEVGVLNLLRDRGFEVRPVELSIHSDATAIPNALLLEGGIRYTNDSLHFSVDLPEMPEPVAEGGPPTHLMLQAQSTPAAIHVLVAAQPLKAGQETMDLDALVAKEIIVDGPRSIQATDLQGVATRRIAFEGGGTQVNTLLTVRHGRLIMVVARTDDAALARSVLDSFRFTDLPE